MKTFDLPSRTSLKVVKVTPHKEVHGKDLVQAISLRLEWRPMDNGALNLIAPGVQDALLWIPPEHKAQDSLDGIPQVMKWRRCSAMKMPVNFPSIGFTGYDMVIEHGIDESSALELYKCKLDKFEAEVDGNGLTVIRWSQNSNKQITPELLGALCGLEGLSIIVASLTPPSQDEPIDGTTAAFKKDYPQAGDLFAEIHGGGNADDDEAGGDDPDPDEEDGPPVPTSRRTQRPAARYRNAATGETWSGRGLQPKWMKSAIAAGARLEEFEVSAQPTH